MKISRSSLVPAVLLAAWEFLRNTKLNAMGYFKPANGKPVFQQNQFGGARNSDGGGVRLLDTLG